MDDEVSGYDSDLYTPTIVPAEAAALPITDGTTANRWYDTYKNNRMRLVNTVPDMTDYETALYTDVAFWQNDDEYKWGGPDRMFSRFVIKPNGLSVGDEWIESGYRPSNLKKNYQAVPFANIKAGIPVVAFANQVRRGLDLIDNPYKNYATTIIVRPGDALNGKLCGGKIFVNFTEKLSEDDKYYGGADLVQDYWINYAYDQGAITENQKNIYLNAEYNIDRKLAAGTITQTEYNKQAFWSSNGMYVLQQNTPIGDDSDTSGKGGVQEREKEKIRKVDKKNKLSFRSVAGVEGLWFTSTYAFAYPRVTVDIPSFLTRGFRWLSNKETPEGTVIGALAMTASAVTPQAQAIPDRIISAAAAPMIANARITETYGYTPNSINNLSLPMEASAMINEKVFKIDAVPMTATASIPQVVRALTSSVDEVILYIMHEDPILYLREEVIK